MSQKRDDNFYKYLMEDDDDDSDEQLGYFLIFLSTLASKYSPRPSFFVRNRIEWNTHVTELFLESSRSFYQLYRMNLPSFNKLCSLIDPVVRVDPVMSHVRTGKGPILTEIALHCLLRWLAGGSHLDIRISAGISIASFYTCIHRCIDAVLTCNQLAINFPKSMNEIEASAQEFQKISSGGIVDGCVACVDGMLLPIRTPSSNETGNVMAYYSGHYAEYGINIQAACDSFCRFVYVSVAAPGRSSDVVAYRKISLSQIIEDLPLGKYVIGNNAYVCSEHLLTPFAGEHRHQPQNDTYNYHISQMRI